MFARSSTFTGDPSAIDAGIAFVRDDVMPMTAEINGCVGLSMMVDREAGQCIATTSWETEEAMKASDGMINPVRDQVAKVLGSLPIVEEWEVAVMHRDHATGPGACCRVTWMRTDHADIDRGIGIYRMAILPRLESMEGFCSASLMVNRATSRACATVSYDSTEALVAGRDEAWAIRDAGVRDAGVDVLDAAEFDLALAHLRVPELA